MGSVVIRCDGSRVSLRVAHFFESDAVWDGAFASVIQRARLCFRSGGHDVLYDCREDVDCAIGEGAITFSGHVVVGCGPALGSNLRKVRGVSVKGEDHVAGAIADGGVWMGG